MNNSIYDLMSHEKLKNISEQDFADMITNDIQYKLNMKIEKNAAGKLIASLTNMDRGKPISYLHDPNVEIFSQMEKINLDHERAKDILSGKGFIIKAPKSIKKSIKDIDGIYSSRFGQQLGDLNPYADRYKCSCGNLTGRINNGCTCPKCNSIVKYIGDQYDYYGWFVIKDHCIIHPTIYAQLEFFFGGTGGRKGEKDKKSKLYNILCYKKKVDESGHEMELDPEDIPKDQPFFGIGMDEFQERFDEIMDYYLKKNPNKQKYYEDIMANKDRVFSHSIPCFTTCLRPFDVNGNNMRHDPINGYYTTIQHYVYQINKQENRFDSYKKSIQTYLFDTQMKLMKIWYEIIDILKDKKGRLRNLIAGRFNFSSRAVIVQNTDLRIDQIRLPYAAMCIMLEQKIKNVLSRTHHYSPNAAHERWQKAITNPDKEVMGILDSFIAQGMPILLNRNPTIAYGSILCLYVVGYTMDLTIGVPLQILQFLAAD